METIDFIEFHDGTIEGIERRGDGVVAIVFDHLYVCVRRGDDHGGWSYRAELVLSGVSHFEVDGTIVAPSKRSKGAMTYIGDGAVVDSTGAELDPRDLLVGADARRVEIAYYDPCEVNILADIAHAKLTLLAAVERIEDCYVRE